MTLFILDIITHQAIKLFILLLIKLLIKLLK